MEKLGIRPEPREIICWVVKVNAPVLYFTGQLEWISAAEGTKFARVMKELEEMRKHVTKEEIAEAMKVLADDKKPKTVPVRSKAKLQLGTT